MEDGQDLPEDEHYSDDPVSDPKIDWFYKLRSFAPIAIVMMVTTIYLPSTVGGKISLNSNASTIEFGQAVPQTVVCTENSSLTLTPYNYYLNSSGTGTNLFSSFKIEGIPPRCLGKDITLAAFDSTSSTPLTLFDSDTVPAIVAKVYISPDNTFYPVNSPSFRVVKNSDTSFTAVFDNPVGFSTNVAKITLQTSEHSPAGIIWDSRLSSTGENFQDIAYGNGIFLTGAMANCSGRTSMYSTNGINWTNGANARISSLTFGNGRFVGGCEFLNIASTTNGLAWTSPTGSKTGWANFEGAVFGNGIYIMGGSGSSNSTSIWRSTNTTTWSGVSGVGADWDEFAYGNGTFVAIAFCQTALLPTQNGSCGDTKLKRLMSSSDLGLTWTQRTIPNTNAWTSVTYGNGLFVAVSYPYTLGVAAGEAKKIVMTSPDGITWTSRTVPDAAALQGWSDVTYGNGLFVAISNYGGGDRVMTSPDGINWTLQKAAVNNDWRAITYGNGRFVAVSNSGTTGNRIMTSG